jgi:hypothetical protein
VKRNGWSDFTLFSTESSKDNVNILISLSLYINVGMFLESLSYYLLSKEESWTLYSVSLLAINQEEVGKLKPDNLIHFTIFLHKHN